MTVKELRNILSNYSDDMEVLTKKSEILGNVACVNSVKEDSYSFLAWILRVYYLQMSMSQNRK